MCDTSGLTVAGRSTSVSFFAVGAPQATVVVQQSTSCAGDCNGDGEVSINELLTMVNIALGNAAASDCLAGDANGDGEITINEILAAVNRALNGC